MWAEKSIDEQPSDPESGVELRVTYEEIVEVDRLKRSIETREITRANGYAVLLESAWYWFPAREPAYTFGRAGRMSAQVGHWRVQEAAHEVRWDPTRNRDVVTLYVVRNGIVDRDPESDRTLVGGFVDGLNPESSHWNPRPKGGSKRA